MNTTFFLMAQYDGAALIPLKRVCSDYFAHLGEDRFLRKALAGQISIPIVRMGPGQKAARGVHIKDLAAYIDAQHEKALKEARQLTAAL